MPDVPGDHLFRRVGVVDVDAAVVGISRARWCAIRDDQVTDAEARTLMQRSKFDVLPVVGGDATVRAYFQTESWSDYSSVNRKRITYEDVLPCECSLRDLIKALAEKDRRFFFLTYEQQVVGLVTVANLNARQVHVYLYSLLSEFEKRLGQFITSRIGSRAVEKALGQGAAYARFRADEKHGVEAEPVEYLGFPQLIELAHKCDLIQELDLRTPGSLDVRQLRHLRNRIAHPIRSVVGRATSVRGLWDWIRLVEELLFGLRMIQGEEAA